MFALALIAETNKQLVSKSPIKTRFFAYRFIFPSLFPSPGGELGQG
jgi:hypothetical protein